MNLINELLKFYELLGKHGMHAEEPTLNMLEGIADNCVDGNFKEIKRYIKIGLSPEIYNELYAQYKEIKKVSREG